MLVLAFDTSTSKGGVAIVEGDIVLSRSIWEREGSHGELLTPQIEKCLKDAGRSTQQLDGIAVGHGPGSFTGVRIAVNAARSLSFALSKPVYVFDTATVLAAAVARTDLPIVSLVNAHKNLIFTATFLRDPSNGQLKRTKDVDALSIEELDSLIQTPHLCVGDGYLEYEAHFSPVLKSRLVRDSALPDYPLPETVGRLAGWCAAQGPTPHGPLVWNAVQALYIRASGAEEKLAEDARNKRS